MPRYGKSMRRLVGLITALVVCAPLAWSETGAVTFNAEEVLKSFELLEKGQAIEYLGTRHESLNDFAKALDGLTITGSGSVVSVITNSRRAKVTILSKGSSPKKGYNIVLITVQDAKNDLFKGDHVVFKGKIGNVSAWRNVSLDVEGTYEMKK